MKSWVRHRQRHTMTTTVLTLTVISDILLRTRNFLFFCLAVHSRSKSLNCIQQQQSQTVPCQGSRGGLRIFLEGEAGLWSAGAKPIAGYGEKHLERARGPTENNSMGLSCPEL